MVSFKDIRQSIFSFITRKKPPPPDQTDQIPQGQQPIKRRSDPAMNPIAKAQGWIPWSSTVRSEGEPSLSDTHIPRKRERSPSTSPSSRKRQLLDQDYVSPVGHVEEDFEGPTLVDTDDGGGDTEQSDFPGHAKQEDGVFTDAERDTITAAEEPWGDESSEENRGSGTSLEDLEENTAAGDSDYSSSNFLSENGYDEPPPFPKELLEMPKMDRDSAPLGSDDEYAPSGSCSEAEDSEDEILPPPSRARSGFRSRRRSRKAHSSRDIYRPSETEDSEDDILPPPPRTRSGSGSRRRSRKAHSSRDIYRPSETEDSEDEILPPLSRARSGSRSRSTSRPRRRSGSTHSRQDIYRPSPDIVNKDLTGRIVSRYAEESDLSEEEIIHEKVAVRKDDKKEVAYDETMKLTRKRTKTITLPEGHWTHAEEDLYFRLAMRGFEPIIPSNWSIDFPTFPNTLFVHPGAPEPYIHSNYGTEFRATKFLSDLLFVGNRVRDRIISGFRPEPVIGRYLNNYIKWAMRDMNLHNRPNLIPLHAIYAQRNSRDSRLALQTLNRRLVVLANRYREAWSLWPRVEDSPEPSASNENPLVPRYLDRKFPVITGFLICGSLVIVLTLNSDPAVNPELPPDASAKLISRLDFGKWGQDVWNALAVAISVVRVRKNILELMEDCADDPMWAVDEDMGVVDDPDI
ncbi:hypothetical protein FQN54_006276 [Arachnomyces sp. PD_36]|nr:hypothetical protein FQN54_006276 [Arachnomyces sp. PD_36]